VTTWEARPTPRALVVAGMISGVGGTATSVGGPPVALLYQRSGGATLRATMGMYFLIGNVSSVLALVLAGQIGGQDLSRAVLLLPFLICGFLLSGPLRRHVDGARLRVTVLVVSAASAVLLVVRTVVGG
jgi:uncharacterized membrane protein YfcA